MYFEQNNLTLKEILFIDDKYNKEELNDFNEFNIIDNCKNETGLEDSVVCVNKYIKKFYNYRIRDSDKKMSFDRLKITGGDCSDWSLLWESIIDNMNTDLNYKPISFGVNDEIAHRISLVSNEEGYCFVDGTQIDCYFYNYE